MLIRSHKLHKKIEFEKKKLRNYNSNNFKRESLFTVLKTIF